MNYILVNGYVDEISFGGIIQCKSQSCVEYVGAVPEGYSSLIDWASKANIRAYKIIGNNLVYDAAKDAALQAEWKNAPSLGNPYPIGSIYLSINSTNPKTFFGGEWEQLKDRFLLGAGDTYAAGSTGGEAAHTLTVNEMPSHSHANYGGASTTSSGGSEGMDSFADGFSSFRKIEQGTYATGGGAAHNNMPPYLTVYMWKRIA